MISKGMSPKMGQVDGAYKLEGRLLLASNADKTIKMVTQ